MGNLFGKAPTPPPAPAVIPPPTMPDPNSPATLAARRKAIADASAGGRTSTILTTPGSRGQGTLAGSYGGSKLGSNS
jgi:hypothetical protein